MRSLVRELVEAAPPAPEYEQILASANDTSGRAGTAPRIRVLQSSLARTRSLPVRLALLGIVIVVVAATATIIEATESGPSSAAILKELADTSVVSSEAGTIVADITVTPFGFTTPIRYVEKIDSRTGNREETLRVPEPSAGGALFEWELFVGSMGYVRITKDLSEPIDSVGWYRYPVIKASGAVPVTPDAPGQVHGVIGTPKSIGDMTIDGVSTHGYAVIISVAKLKQEATTTMARESIEGELSLLGVKSFRSDVWLDSSGEVRELQWWIRYPSTGQTASNIETLSYLKQRLVVSAPPTRDTGSASSYDQASEFAWIHVQVAR
jgi:hypothetical protein